MLRALLESLRCCDPSRQKLFMLHFFMESIYKEKIVPAS